MYPNGRTPLLGDRLYGMKQKKQRRCSEKERSQDSPRPMLHSAELVIPHPIRDGKLLRLRCAPPEDFAERAKAILGPQVYLPLSPGELSWILPLDA